MKPYHKLAPLLLSISLITGCSTAAPASQTGHYWCTATSVYNSGSFSAESQHRLAEAYRLAAQGCEQKYGSHCSMLCAKL